MNLIRQLRLQAAATQHDLAARAGTSQSAIPAYEAGTKSPTLRTVEKLASSLGLELFAVFVPPMTREDHRSLAYHRAIAEILQQDPAPLVSRARKNLTKLAKLHRRAAPLLTRWWNWLELPTEELVCRMLAPDVTAREMRQVSPFSGVLTPAQRAKILRDFRREHAQ